MKLEKIHSQWSILNKIRSCYKKSLNSSECKVISWSISKKWLSQEHSLKQCKNGRNTTSTLTTSAETKEQSL